MNEELKAVICIIGFTLLQGTYDWLFWGLWFDDNEAHPLAKPYRVMKETLDFGVTGFVMIAYLHLWWYDIAWFFALKLCHSCDRWFNRLDFVFKHREASFWGYWRWWVFPYGWLRTNWFGVVHIKEGYTYRDYELCEKYNRPFPYTGPEPVKQYITFNAARGMVNITEVDKVSNWAWAACLSFYFVKFIIGMIQ